MLTINGLRVGFPIRRGILRRHIGTVRAVDGVDLVVPRGKTVALVGESGSGKSTLARAIVGLTDVDAGSIVVDGLGDIVGRTNERRFRRRVQLVFQDPYTSLNPRMPLGAIVGEPLRVHGIARGAELARRIDELFELVGLDSSMTRRYPHELSGGQRQRIGLARALALEPDLVILDEPASALDVSVQAQVVALLARLQAELGLAYLLIAHDLALVEQIADRVAVMYFGRIVEHGDVEQVLGNARHPYTRSLIASTPGHGRSAGRTQVSGEPPSPLDPQSGCAFRSRCRHAIDECASIDPELTIAPNGALVACIRSCDLDNDVSVVPVESRGRSS